MHVHHYGFVRLEVLLLFLLRWWVTHYSRKLKRFTFNGSWFLTVLFIRLDECFRNLVTTGNHGGRNLIANFSSTKIALEMIRLLPWNEIIYCVTNVNHVQWQLQHDQCVLIFMAYIIRQLNTRNLKRFNAQYYRFRMYCSRLSTSQREDIKFPWPRWIQLNLSCMRKHRTHLLEAAFDVGIMYFTNLLTCLSV